MKPSQFDSVADKYEKLIPAHIFFHYLNKRVAFVRGIINNGLILDVGCGTGLLAERLEHLGFTVVGLEPAAGMLKELKRMNRIKANTAVRGTSELLPFKSDSFDLVLTIVTLHHIGDKKRIIQTISEMVRVAKPGARILIWDHNLNNPYWSILMKRLPWDHEVTRLIPLEEIVEGLKVEKVKAIKIYRKGFIPDFVPGFFLPLAKFLELCLELTPIARNFSAHNVIVAEKG